MPKIFIINLKRSAERREFMRKQTDMLPPEFEVVFFAAFDAAQNEHLQFAEHFRPIWSRMFKGRVLKEGEKACFASHYSLWEKCIQLNEPIFVLEDDVRLAGGFSAGVEDICKSGYEFVRLFGNFAKGLYPLGGNYHLSFEKTSGALGYYITPVAAAKLLGKAPVWFCPVDDLMDLSFYTKVPNIIFRPYLLEHAGTHTTIAPVRKGSSGQFWKLIREVGRIFRFIYKRSYIFFNKKRLLAELSQSRKV